MNVYCSKSINQRAREGMRMYRTRRRSTAILNIIQNGGDQTAPGDISSATNQVSIDATNDLPTTTANHSTSALDFESSNDSIINPKDNADHGIDTQSECDALLQVESDNDDISIQAESDDDVIDEVINAFDLNNQTKLFGGSPISVRNACFILIKLSRRLNLNKDGIQRLLDDIRCLFPPDARLPRTVRGLMKIIGIYRIPLNILSLRVRLPHFPELRVFQIRSVCWTCLIRPIFSLHLNRIQMIFLYQIRLMHQISAAKDCREIIDYLTKKIFFSTRFSVRVLSVRQNKYCDDYIHHWDLIP